MRIVSKIPIHCAYDEIRDIASLVPNPRNPNQHPENQIQLLAKIIKNQGWRAPITVSNRSGFVVRGHGRLMAAQLLGLDQVPIDRQDYDSEAEEWADLVADNRIAELAEIDEDKLKELLQELNDGDFDLDLTGFDEEQIKDLIGVEDTEIDPPVNDDDFDVQDALDEITEPETKYGELWRLGRHFLMCGDATKKADVYRLMQGNKAALVVTDPPYNVAVESLSERLSSDGRENILNDDMPAEEFKKFLDKVFARYAEVMDPKAAIYIFHPSSYQREFEDSMNAAGIVTRAQCVWVKNATTFGFAQYKYKHEPVFYAFLKGKAPAWYGDRKQTTVWKAGLPVENPEPVTVWEVSRGNVNKYVHPTQKPLDLLAIPVGNSSRQGDLVVDLFGGSGSTLMTCEQMQRACMTMELDPVFCDVIKKRFYEATGIEPVLVS
ncbi:MAG: site-specific DNA-methyltransferase [Firmicutes bacterium]|nr:site-specific DNA-methyltransferase [Bacillota bacterium]